MPDQQARQGFLPNATTGVYSKVPNLNPTMLQYMSYWPQPNGAELLVPTTGLPSGTASSFNSAAQNIREDFGTLRADYNLAERRHTFSLLHYRRRHQPRPAGRSALCFRQHAAHAGVQLAGNARFLAEHSQYRPRRFFARRLRSQFGSCLASFPANLDFVTGAGPGGIVIGGGVSTTGTRRAHFRRAEQCRGSLQSPQPFHLCGRFADQQGQTPAQLRGLVPARAGQ